MRTRLAFAAFAGLPAAALISVVLLSPPAVAAQPNINVALCVQASLRVDDAGRLANTAADALAAVVTFNAGLQADVDTALAALLTATRAVENAGTPAALTTALTNATTARANLTAAVNALVGVSPTSVQRTALVDAQAALQLRINEAMAACAPAVVPPGDEDDDVTTTPATPTPLPDDEDDELPPLRDDQFSRVPSGGVDTGSVPA